MKVSKISCVIFGVLIASAYFDCLLAECVVATKKPSRAVKFLLMSDTHIESDFSERGNAVYICWKAGNHASLVKTYEFINRDPYCRDIDFALFCGDQLNTGYTWAEGKELDEELAIWNMTLDKLDIHSKTKKCDLSSFRFTALPWTCRENLGKGRKPFSVTPPPLASCAIAIQGNHDTGVKDFYRDCAFTCGGVRFICFFASYVGLPPPSGKKYHSTGAISDDTITFIEREMKASAGDTSIKRIVLSCHWGIAAAGKNFVHPIIDACESNKQNNNRRKLLDLCKRYGCDLFINGHEHNAKWPFESVDSVVNINCGSVTSVDSSFAIVEVHSDKTIFNVYSRAVVKENGGELVTVKKPSRQFSRVIAAKVKR